jgi:linoleoyl-CoA desaturase
VAFDPPASELARGSRSSPGAGFALFHKISFDADAGFHVELKRRVHEHFRRLGLSLQDSPRMVLKTAAILIWFAASYVLLVFLAATWWQGALLAASLALSLAGIGFAIQHDANHGAYSRHPSVNRTMGMTLDLLGGSSYLWHWKHNVLHHTYTGLPGADHDLDAEPFARFSTTQARRPMHGAQQIYAWALYGFMLHKWHFVDDFENVARGRLGVNRIPRPRGWRLFELFAGKAAFFGWALAIPLLFHRWWIVLLFYGATTFVISVVLSVVFQLAHCVETSQPAALSSREGRVAESWAVHQVHTSVDFARGNRLLTWYLGGLNYQIEHHLFPKMCHVHYPGISGIVQTTCADFGVRYQAHDGLAAALSSHWRWLRRMGQAGSPVTAAP